MRPMRNPASRARALTRSFDLGDMRWAPSSADPYLFYTASLVPIVLIVALLARRPDGVVSALLASAAAILAQWGLGRIGRRLRRSDVRWQLVRLAVALAYVAVASRTVGGPAIPLLALYAPVVAAAAAAGVVQGAVTASFAAAVLMGPELANPGSGADVALRGTTLAGITVVIALGTRRIVSALELSVQQARRAVLAERRRSRQIEALDAVNRVLARGGPTPELLQQLVDEIARRFGYPCLSLYLGDEEHVQLAAQHGYAEPLPAFTAGTGIAGSVMQTGEIAFVPDVSTDSGYVPAPDSATSLICAPLVVDGRLEGVFNVETNGGRRLDGTDRALVAIIAGRIGAAIALGRDRQALAARAELFRDIERFGRQVSAALAIEPLAQAIIDSVGRVVSADGLAVTILDRSRSTYVVRAVRGLPDAVVGSTIGPGDGLAGRAIRDRVLVIDHSTSPAKYPVSVRHLDLPVLCGGLGVPLIHDGVVNGALTIARADGDAEFTELELEAVQLLASHAALAVANAFLHADVAELAVRDPLTGLYNRRHFDEALERMLAARRRERLSGWRPLSAITFDLDRFGAFNKEHGHQVGDLVLKAFAEVLRQRFRATDLVARLGGEEFTVILDGANLDEAVAVADEVRSLLADRPVAVDGRRLQVPVSAGCAELDAAAPTRDALLRTTDVALFMAKRAGRDRVVAA